MTSTTAPVLTVAAGALTWPKPVVAEFSKIHFTRALAPKDERAAEGERARGEGEVAVDVLFGVRAGTAEGRAGGDGHISACGDAGVLKQEGAGVDAGRAGIAVRAAEGPCAGAGFDEAGDVGGAVVHDGSGDHAFGVAGEGECFAARAGGGEGAEEVSLPLPFCSMVAPPELPARLMTRSVLVLGPMNRSVAVLLV